MSRCVCESCLSVGARDVDGKLPRGWALRRRTSDLIGVFSPILLCGTCSPSSRAEQ